MTYALREVRPRSPCALAARMTRVIALIALATLELPGAPVHEPVHARGPLSRHPTLCVTLADWPDYGPPCPDEEYVRVERLNLNAVERAPGDVTDKLLGRLRRGDGGRGHAAGIRDLLDGVGDRLVAVVEQLLRMDPARAGREGPQASLLHTPGRRRCPRREPRRGQSDVD